MGTLEEAKREDIPELDYRYPEYYIFGTLPAYGLYARHVNGLVIDNVKFEVEKSDLRCVIVCDDVEDLEMSDVTVIAMGDMEADAIVKLKNVKKAFIHGCRSLNRVKTFLKLEGNNCEQIINCVNNL